MQMEAVGLEREGAQQHPSPNFVELKFVCFCDLAPLRDPRMTTSEDVAEMDRRSVLHPFTTARTGGAWAWLLF